VPSATPKRPKAATTIALVRGNSLATLTQRELARQIVSGEITAGTRLNGSDIADALGVSRGPVREAFRALDEAGLVRVEKNRGVFVREVTLDEANEIYEVRAALEGLIGRLAARRHDEREIAELGAVVRRMKAHDRARKAEPYFALNVEFHELLAQAARNTALLTHYRRVVNELDLYRRETIARRVDHIPVSTREHEAIVAAVADRDEALAERLLYDHVLMSRERLHRALADRAPRNGRRS
jgi:DNA-binding GntR family transcriptional regulator